MNTKLKNIFIFILIQFSTLVIGQSTDYPRKTVDGIEYYIYTVQPQEGLYAISKRFNTTQQVISDLNPEVNDGLKNGQTILLPIFKYKNEANIHPKNNAVKIEYLEHIVLKRQTLFSICRKYKVDLNIVKSLNPQLENGLKTGDTLKIPVLSINNQEVNTKPVSKSIITPVPVENKASYRIHKVKSKETLYSISKLYEVEIENIIKLNPEVKSKLKRGTEIKVPKESSHKSSNDLTISESNVKNESTNNTSKQDKKAENEKKSPIRIAFLLPLMIDQTIAELGNEKFIEFYKGSLLAINEAKKKGNSFEIFSYDTEKSESKMAEVLTNTELKRMDFIIGPAFTNQVAMMSDFSRLNKINTLIPFSSKLYDIDVNPYLIQFNPGIKVESKFVANILESKFKNAQVIIVELNENNNSVDENLFVPYLKSELYKLNRKYFILNSSNREQIDFKKFLNKNEKNIIIFNSNRISTVSNYFSALYELSNEYEISLYKQYGWLNNDEIKIKGFYISPFQSELNSFQLKKFQDLFDIYFYNSTTMETPRYDLLGYDLTKHFIDLIINKGTKFNSGLFVLPESKGIQSHFNFERNSTKAGFVNNHFFYFDN